MTTALAERPAQQIDKRAMTVKNLFESCKDKMAAVVPKHLKPERLLRVALNTISRDSKLLNCTPHSLLNSFMTATQLGLEIGGVLGEAYLVPFVNEAKFLLGYRGAINLARRSGQIATIEAKVVRDGDEFDFEYGLEMKFRHKPKAPLGADILYAWALCRFREEGSYQLDVMTIDEINAIRKRSRAANDGPWVTDFAEMAKKTVVRRLCKYLPLSPEMADAIELSDRTEFPDLIDAELVTPPTPQKKKAARLADELSQEQPENGNGDDSQQQPPIEESQEPGMDPGEAFEIQCAELAASVGIADAKFANGFKKFLIAKGKVGNVAGLTKKDQDELTKAIKDRAGHFA